MTPVEIVKEIIRTHSADKQDGGNRLASFFAGRSNAELRDVSPFLIEAAQQVAIIDHSRLRPLIEIIEAVTDEVGTRVILGQWDELTERLRTREEKRHE